MATKICPQCAEEVKAEAKICRFCEYEFEQIARPEQRSLVKKNKVLKDAIVSYVNQGWVLINENENIAQLSQPKKFNWPLFLILLFVGIFMIGLPLFIYLLYYMVQKDKLMTLSTNDRDELLVNGVKTTPPPAVTTTTQVAAQSSQSNEEAPKTNYKTLWIFIAVCVGVFTLLMACCSCSYLVPFLGAGSNY